MFHYEAMHEERESGSPEYMGGEEFLMSSSAGQKLSQDAPGWEVFPFLFVLTLFTAAVVSINVAFSRRVW